jgi:5'-deoxynucleotidase YfbR-like HD superfamily hydrolase
LFDIESKIEYDITGKYVSKRKALESAMEKLASL